MVRREAGRSEGLEGVEEEVDGERGLLEEERRRGKGMCIFVVVVGVVVVVGGGGGGGGDVCRIIRLGGWRVLVLTVVQMSSCGCSEKVGLLRMLFLCF